MISQNATLLLLLLPPLMPHGTCGAVSVTSRPVIASGRARLRTHGRETANCWVSLSPSLAFSLALSIHPSLSPSLPLLFSFSLFLCVCFCVSLTQSKVREKTGQMICIYIYILLIYYLLVWITIEIESRHFLCKQRKTGRKMQMINNFLPVERVNRYKPVTFHVCI